MQYFIFKWPCTKKSTEFFDLFNVLGIISSYKKQAQKHIYFLIANKMKNGNLGITTILVIIILHLGSHSVQGILRNPATDRCIHVEKSDEIEHGVNKLVVTAHPCSFRNPKTGHGDNPDQWVEIVPMSKLPQVKDYTIQKHFQQEKIFCIQTQPDDTISTGDCKSLSAILHFTKILKRSSLEVMFPGAIFTIQQPNTNKCISVMPGMSELQLTNCTQANVFQRWIACRNGGACDVDITWSPARIIFPNDPFNISSDFEEMPSSLPSSMEKLIELKDQSELGPSISEPRTTSSPPARKASTSSTIMENDSTPKIIINELLYFVLNGLKVMKLPESKLISIITNFYTPDEIQEALDTLKENFFMIQIDPRSIAVHKTIQILHWMKQITTRELDSNVIFASEQISRVPPISAMNPEAHKPSSADSKKFQNLKSRVETNINLVMEKLQDLKTGVLSDLDHLAHKNSSSSEVSDSRGVNNDERNDEMVEIIDLRLGLTNNKELLRRRYYE